MKVEQYQHLDRMQRRVMDKDSHLTKREFFAESEEEQIRYYNWMRAQVGEFSDLV